MTFNVCNHKTIAVRQNSGDYCSLLIEPATRYAKLALGFLALAGVLQLFSNRLFPDHPLVKSYVPIHLTFAILGLVIREMQKSSKAPGTSVSMLADIPRHRDLNNITLPETSDIEAANDTFQSKTSNFIPVRLSNNDVCIMIRTPYGRAEKVEIKTCVDDGVRPTLTLDEFKEMKRAGEEFAIDHGIYKGKLQKLLDATNVSGLVYVKYHGVSLEIGKALTNWVIALFAVDDSRDLLTGTKDLSEVKVLGDTKIAWLYHMINKGDEPRDSIYNNKDEVKAIRGAFDEVIKLINKLHYNPITDELEPSKMGDNPTSGLNEAQIVRRTGLITSLLIQWVKSFEYYINSVHREKEMEANQDTRAFFGKQADEVRNEACGGLHAFILSALLRGTNITKLESTFPWLVPLKTQVCNHVQWFNDLVSYRKEKEEWEKQKKSHELFCASLGFNKINSLVRDRLLTMDGTTMSGSSVTNNDKRQWMLAEERAFMSLVDKINDQFQLCIKEIHEHLDTLNTELKKPELPKNQRKVYADAIELLLDLKGWLNQGVWAAFSDRYAGTGIMTSDFALEQMQQAMTLSSNSSLSYTLT